MDVIPRHGKVCYRCLVEGRVQGVAFRAATRRQAMSRGVGGYARNLPDGRVEVLVCGEEAAVAQMRTWLLSGPPAARVTDVSCELLPYVEREEFHIE